MRIAPLVAFVVTGCFAGPPPPASLGDLGGCHPGAYAILSEFECRRDSDCLLCGDRLRSRAELELTNEPCPPPEDDSSSAACCQGRCVESLGPPPL